MSPDHSGMKLAVGPAFGSRMKCTSIMTALGSENPHSDVVNNVVHLADAVSGCQGQMWVYSL